VLASLATGRKTLIALLNTSVPRIASPAMRRMRILREGILTERAQRGGRSCGGDKLSTIHVHSTVYPNPCEPIMRRFP
jgi:hypothetical protein